MNTNTAITNTTEGVLSLDNLGNVIWVKDQTGSGGGTGITQAQNGLSINPSNSNIVELGGNATSPAQVAASGLLSNRELPLNGEFIQFSGVGDIGIGGASGAPADKLFIQENKNAPRGITIINSNSGNGAIANIYFQNDALKVGSLGLRSSTTPVIPNELEMFNGGNIYIHTQPGSDVKIESTLTGIVALGTVDKTNLPSTTRVAIHDNLVIESASGSPNTYLQLNQPGTTNAAMVTGTYSGSNALLYLYPSGSTTRNISLLAGTNDNCYFNTGGKVGINKAVGITATLDVVGNIFATGTIISSDSILKTNIQPIANTALQKVKSLRPVSYEWITKYDTLMYGTQYGFTAQQVATIIPDLVRTDSLGTKSLNYNGMIAFLTKAVQEQQQQMDSMKTVMSSCCSSQQARTAQNSNNGFDVFSKTTQEVKLTLPIGISISEARPNPNSGKAEIDYYIPSNISSAKVIFTDLMARNISEVKLNAGYGTLAIDTKELPSGMYSFTLVADGKVIDTKKMMKQD